MCEKLTVDEILEKCVRVSPYSKTMQDGKDEFREIIQALLKQIQCEIDREGEVYSGNPFIDNKDCIKFVRFEKVENVFSKYLNER